MKPKLLRSLTVCYVIAVAIQIAWYVACAGHLTASESLLGWMPKAYSPPLIARVVGLCLLLISAIGIRYPIAAAASVTATAFGIARYSAELEWAWVNAFQFSVILNAAVALTLNPQLHSSWSRFRQKHFTTGVLLAGVMVWAIVSEVLAIAFQSGEPGPKHHVLRIIESVILCAVIVTSITDFKRFVVVVAVAIFALGATFLQLNRLEHASDFAFAAAPLSCLVAGTTSALSAAYVVPGALLSLLLASASFLTANRAANVGWALTMTCLVVVRIRSVRAWAVLGILIAVSSVVAYQSPLRPRIEEWVDHGWSTTTLASRIEFWKSSLSQTPNRLFTGFGPGRGGQEMSKDLHLNKWRATHNSLLEMLSEQGVIGLLLWCCLLFSALKTCLLKLRRETAYERAMAMGIGAYLLAMLVASMAISRHDDPRLFWAIGCAFAMNTARFDTIRRPEIAS
ncbi:O-antigen ligase family protein [Roseiconus lacunae]|uniref:O-antigen ligase family protein n=1 Tax=Roseiconus lacunae TaxID=2605694 RepID=UPI001E369B9B|nr:O-antigen ligase family protein [Roseiconus lacunae]MCD0458896.1 O-antigen ligase family protein [Roseiconus lacunae]